MANTDNMMNFADFMAQEGMKPIMDIIESIMNIPDESLNKENLDVIIGMIKGGLTPQIRQQSVQSIIDGFETDGLNKLQVKNAIDQFRDGLTSVVDELKPSEHKRTLLNSVLELFYEMFDAAAARYHTYDIELPMKLDEGATVPTYAHEDDAAADLYALEDMTIPAHSLSNKVRTGIYIELPENWKAHIDPRSSIGSKTGLRLSNSLGLIDTPYRGELIVLYDNISDSDYEIKAGDRIAQMWVEPIYRFKPVITKQLTSTERNEGGFGSTGR